MHSKDDVSGRVYFEEDDNHVITILEEDHFVVWIATLQRFFTAQMECDDRGDRNYYDLNEPPF